LNKKISSNPGIYLSKSPQLIRSSSFLTQGDTSSRLENLTRSLTEALQKFTESHQKLKSILDLQPENLESENVKDSHDNFDENSSDNLQTGSTILCLKKVDTLLQDAIKRIDISGPSLSHEEEIHLDTDFQEISGYPTLRRMILRNTISLCLTLSTQLKAQLEKIPRHTFDRAYFAETESAETIKPRNQKKPYNFYIGGILSRPKNPLIVFSRKFSARRQLEF